MIETKQDLVEYIKADRSMQPYPKSLMKRLFGKEAEIVRWKTCLRKCEYHCNKRNLFHRIAYFVYLIKLRKYENKYCSEIPINVFGKGLLIWHPERIIVNPHAKIGEFCSISSGVVVAQAHEECPIIGSHVELMIDCKVLGGISVADYVRIGASALVLKDVDEPNVTLGGVPAKKISNKGAKETPVHPIHR